MVIKRPEYVIYGSCSTKSHNKIQWSHKSFEPIKNRFEAIKRTIALRHDPKYKGWSFDFYQRGTKIPQMTEKFLGSKIERNK